ncbi:winged helix-turn-helix domain-containing protein [Kibdelosporangium philippinense]|uniref:Winged helix-turn-helix domain-containing protein n=1 Tax=Kibdelosporangium philippinense TaxID=211113 RepID=A0ABS8Z0R9_9PSEU|nr:BTAD domain-containing putative transcriptional regulator [Kibdelosporangium philippinense]MCE7001561.1 winged helix-turn-helix domain-containing protein [Kibdelosporangium philippinense]
MSQSLRVRLLGVVTARRGETEIDLGPGRQRAVFAVLAMRANQMVSREALMDGVWGDDVPAGAANSLYSYISRLRLALGRSNQVLVSERSGYSLRLGPGELDVHTFDDLRETAQAAWNRRDVAGTREALDAALALWDGEALGGIDSPFAVVQRQRLGELRLAALELRAETLIAASDPSAVSELQRLVRAYPLRESLTGLLMSALVRFGRSSEAVAVFTDIQQRLVDTLGIEPGAALRRLYSEIAGERRASSAPARPAVFVGRSRELSVLRGRLAALDRGVGGTVWVEGGPGVGKSALLAEAFADAGVPVVWGSPSEAAGVSGPAVVVVDDLQDLDEAGLLAWHRLSKQAQSEALLVVGACRPLPRRTEVDRLRAGVGPGGGDVLRLSGLSASDVVALVGCAGSSSVAQVTAGNPGFVLEVVSAIQDSGAAGDGVEATDAIQRSSAVQDVVRRWLGFLSDEAQVLLRQGALVGESFDLGAVASAMGVPVTSLVGPVEEAVDFGFLVEAGHLFRFPHPVVFSALRG